MQVEAVTLWTKGQKMAYKIGQIASWDIVIGVFSRGSRNTVYVPSLEDFQDNVEKSEVRVTSDIE